MDFLSPAKKFLSFHDGPLQGLISNKAKSSCIECRQYTLLVNRYFLMWVTATYLFTRSPLRVIVHVCPTISSGQWLL